MNIDIKSPSKKILYILNVANAVNNFSHSSMIAAQKLGFEFHIAGNWSYESDKDRLVDEKKYGIRIHQIDFIRQPYHLGNKKAYEQLKALVKKEQFDAIHCNTPIGGILGRIVGKICHVPQIIYQAHGFHFYKGAPIVNWMLYYPIERWLARYTDALVTINQEDYELAKKKFCMRNSASVFYVPGVGIECLQYEKDCDKSLRLSLGIKEEIMIISAGDLVDRKNYKIAIEAIAKTEMKNLKYCICGMGPQYKELREYAKNLGIESKILFLGYRSDVKELLKVADIFLFTTKQEGLSRSMMEAMASGLPCVASRVRGNVDLLDDGKGGWLCDVDKVDEYAQALRKLAKSEELRKKMGNYNHASVQKFDISVVVDEMKEIYISIIT